MKTATLFLACALVACASEPDPRTLGCDRTVLFGQGTSMLPTLPEFCRAAIVAIPFDQVRTHPESGDIIATRINGRIVIHRAVARTADGRIVTWGDHNCRPDAMLTTSERYVGVLTHIERPGTVAEILVPAARAPRTGEPDEDCADTLTTATALPTPAKRTNQPAKKTP